MDHIPDVIYFKDIQGRLIFVNRAHARGLGLKPEQVIGKTDFDIFPKQRAEMMFKDDQYVLRTGQAIIDKIERATRPDGVDNYVSTTKIPRFDKNGKVIGLIGVTRDITKRVLHEHQQEKEAHQKKRLETLEDVNKMKMEFISEISHELRTPLAIIHQLLSLVYEETVGPITERQREVLVRAKNNMDRLKTMLDKLLDISRIERKGLRLRYSLVNLKDLLKDSQNFFRELAKEKNINISYDVPSPDIYIFIDQERIAQVINNLINNAIKFTEENGNVHIELKVFENKVRVGVFDSGVGIAKVDLEKIFGKFVQVSHLSSSQRKGLGLGLFIVKELVERHGGEVWAESELGVGSKFYFTLPRFYTDHILDKPVQKRINDMLDKNPSVCLINLLIVNYKEFKLRSSISPAKLFVDLKRIIEDVLKRTREEQSGANQVIIEDRQNGKFNIIFPEQNKKIISLFCKSLIEKTKKYFIEHKREDVFLAVGIVTYSSKDRRSLRERTPSNLNIKEIYVGAEMRRFNRVVYVTNVMISLAKKATLTAKTVDLSSGGLCFMSPRLFKTDTNFFIQLELLKCKKMIGAKVRVAWLQGMERLMGDKTNIYKTGLEFIALKSNDRKWLDRELKLYYG